MSIVRHHDHSKEDFGGQYVSPRIQRHRPHSWEDESLELQFELREAQRRLHEARVTGDLPKIREAELEATVARERYDVAVNICGSEAMFGLTCAVRMGRDPSWAIGPLVDEVLKQVARRMTEGGVA